jgi:hypothetical protein
MAYGCVNRLKPRNLPAALAVAPEGVLASVSAWPPRFQLVPLGIASDPA